MTSDLKTYISILDIRNLIQEYVQEPHTHKGFDFKTSSVDTEWELSKLYWWLCLDSDGSSSYLIEFRETSYNTILKVSFKVVASDKGILRSFETLKNYGADVYLSGLYLDDLNVEYCVEDLSALVTFLDELCPILNKYI